MREIKPLTKEFLLNRGKCCGSGCLNCPYYPKHTKNNTNIKEEYVKIQRKIK